MFSTESSNLKFTVLFSVYMPNYIVNFIIVTELPNDFTDLYMNFLDGILLAIILDPSL